MRLIDLTHLISETMPVYPGTEPPSLRSANTYEKDGFKETLLTMYSHTGTHMDPPAHLYAGRTTLDQFPVEQFVGRGLVIHCPQAGEGMRIPFQAVQQVRTLADQADFLLFDTGWSAHWGTPRYFGEYPYIDDEIVDYLIAHGKKGVGLDTIGVDPIADGNLTIHKKLFLHNEIVVIENLANLDKVGEGLFTFLALPLRYQDADGSPIRAVAMVEE